MMGWQAIGTLADIPRLGARVVWVAGEEVAIFRTEDDTLFALRDSCPHKGGKLSQGIVHGVSVTCPLHNWVIGLADGLAAAPDEGCAHRYAVKLEQGQIWLSLAQAHAA